MVKHGVLDSGRWELHAELGTFSKNLVEIDQSTLLAVFGRFCMAVLWRGFDRKMPIFGPWSGILAGWLLGTTLQFSKFPQTTDHLLCAFWTAGITARPPDIGSTTCSRILIFQVSNRTIRCILDKSGGCREDFVWICLSSVGWLGQRWEVQLFRHEIYAASRLFCAHSAILMKSYL